MDSLLDFINNGLKSEENEFQIIYGEDETGSDDILSWEDTDYEKYNLILDQVSEIITEEYKKDNRSQVFSIFILGAMEKEDCGRAEKWFERVRCLQYTSSSGINHQ